MAGRGRLLTPRATMAVLSAALALGVAATGLPTTATDPSALDLTLERAWVRQFGTGGHEFANGVAVDAKDNAYVVGTTDGQLGQQRHGFNDAFLRKYSPAGRIVWTRQFGGPDYDIAVDVTVTDDGTAYVVAPTGMGYRLVKYRADGRQVWVRWHAAQDAESVTLDRLGRVYVAGAIGRRGDRDAFVRSYTSSGAIRWTRRFGTPKLDHALGVAVAPSGAIYVVGLTEGGFEGQARAGDVDAFVRKLRPDGTHVWTRQFGTPAEDRARDVATAPDGHVIVVGSTLGAFPGQPGPGEWSDAYARSFGPGGEVDWTTQFGAEFYASADAVAISRDGLIHVAGTVTGAMPGMRDGAQDAFLRILDPSGSVASSARLSARQSASGFGVAVGLAGQVYLAGHALGRLPGQQSKGGFDGFISKYRVK